MNQPNLLNLNNLRNSALVLWSALSLAACGGGSQPASETGTQVPTIEQLTGYWEADHVEYDQPVNGSTRGPNDALSSNSGVKTIVSIDGQGKVGYLSSDLQTWFVMGQAERTESQLLVRVTFAAFSSEPIVISLGLTASGQFYAESPSSYNGEPRKARTVFNRITEARVEGIRTHAQRTYAAFYTQYGGAWRLRERQEIYRDDGTLARTQAASTIPAFQEPHRYGDAGSERTYRSMTSLNIVFPTQSGESIRLNDLPYSLTLSMNLEEERVLSVLIPDTAEGEVMPYTLSWATHSSIRISEDGRELQIDRGMNRWSPASSTHAAGNSFYRYIYTRP